jgi:hypothetical protein
MITTAPLAPVLLSVTVEAEVPDVPSVAFPSRVNPTEADVVVALAVTDELSQLL